MHKFYDFMYIISFEKRIHFLFSSEQSSLVSINMGRGLRDHWTIHLSQRLVSFVVNLTRKLAIADSLIAGVMRLAIALAVICSLFLSIVSLASIVQQNWKLYPQFISFKDSPAALLFDHTIANLTLTKLAHHSDHPVGKGSGGKTCNRTQLKTPNYLACDLEWHGYTVLSSN